MPLCSLNAEITCPPQIMEVSCTCSCSCLYGNSAIYMHIPACSLLREGQHSSICSHHCLRGNCSPWLMCLSPPPYLLKGSKDILLWKISSTHKNRIVQRTLRTRPLCFISIPHHLPHWIIWSESKILNPFIYKYCSMYF